jgi:hypothetical protein
MAGGHFGAEDPPPTPASNQIVSLAISMIGGSSAARSNHHREYVVSGNVRSSVSSSPD